MTSQCYLKANSNPPTCGVHNTPLEETKTSSVSGPRSFVCSSSGSTVTTEEARPNLTIAELGAALESQRKRLWHLQNDFMVAGEEEKASLRRDIDLVSQDIERLDSLILGASTANTKLA